MPQIAQASRATASVWSGFCNDDKADVHAIVVDCEAMQIAVAHGGDREADGAVIESHRAQRRRARWFARVDEFGGDQKDEDAGRGAGGDHPEAFAAGGPAGFAQRGSFEAFRAAGRGVCAIRGAA